ncbi:MAG: sirohydrochlorin chelatase [Mariprofundaceae bacterium]|nr:sirohydrochlorin chelatase [Mariprofundaceae bacterium]
MQTKMNDTILLVGHGSREKSGNAEIESFANTWRKRRPDDRIEVCFIEFADTLLDAGLNNAAKNSKRVIVVPLILGAAGHVKMEIPHHIAHAREHHPDVEFIMAKHLGAGTKVFNALKSELHNAMLALDAPDAKNTGVVLLARGSSDKVANGEIAKMARWLFEESDHDMVDLAFTGITFPKVETVVQRQVACGMKQVIILPYYLYTGILIKRIARQVARLSQQYPTISFGLAKYIGFNDAIYELLDERVANAQGKGLDEPHMLECDGCKYRDFSEAHGFGHHHHHD